MLRWCNSCVKWLNLLTLILGVTLIITAAVLYSRTGTACLTFLQGPLIALGILIFIVSGIGLVGSACYLSFALWLYVVLMVLITIISLGFTIFSFVVSAPGHGSSQTGVQFKQYYLDTYSKWMRDELNDKRTWGKVQACMVDGSYCQQLNFLYPDLDQYKAAKLSPTESGCCRPPLECGYQQVTATVFVTTSPPKSTNPDCTLFSNNATDMCFACSSCKAGVAEYVTREWNKVAYVLLFTTILLAVVSVFGCVATYTVESDAEIVEKYRQRWI